MFCKHKYIEVSSSDLYKLYECSKCGKRKVLKDKLLTNDLIIKELKLWEKNQIDFPKFDLTLFIEDEELKLKVKELLDKIPQYFWEIPASSSGKYHPRYALGKGGLYRHTLATLIIAKSLLELDQYSKLAEMKDDIMVALIFHDTFKQGKIKSGHTVFEHPLLASDFLEEHGFTFISKLVSTHMGQWNKQGDIKLPKPKTSMQKFVHLCDYLASRKFLEVNFGELNENK